MLLRHNLVDLNEQQTPTCTIMHGEHRGKKVRFDHCLVSESMKHLCDEFQMIENVQRACGDHHPIMLQLRTKGDKRRIIPQQENSKQKDFIYLNEEKQKGFKQRKEHLRSEVARIAANLGYPNYQSIWAILRQWDNSQLAKMIVAEYCKNNLNRLNRSRFHRHKIGGITGLNVQDFSACDTFSFDNKKVHVLHCINLFSKFSCVKVLNHAPRAADTVAFLKDLRQKGLLTKNILLDLGREFYNLDVIDLLELYSVSAYFTPVAAHWCNGVVERRHRTIRDIVAKLKYIYGPTKLKETIQEAVTAVDECPTRTLDGLSPYQYQFCANPVTTLIKDPESATVTELTRLSAHTPSLEEYRMRQDARAEFERLKCDRQYIAEQQKLAESCRRYYGEGDELKIGDLVEYFDSDAKVWKGPVKLIYKDNLVFVLDRTKFPQLLRQKKN